MSEMIWGDSEEIIERDRAERVARTAWGQALLAGAQGEELLAALKSGVAELCEEARAEANHVEQLNQSRDMVCLMEKRERKSRAHETEAAWVASSNRSGRSAEALCALAREACERGWLVECLAALGEEFAKPGRLPCERIAQVLLPTVARLDEQAKGGQGHMGRWAEAEGFWAGASWAEFGRATRGLWGKKSPDSVFNGGLRESLGEPLAKALATGMRSEALADDAVKLARRVGRLAQGAAPENEFWGELSRGASELLEVGSGPGQAKVVAELPLSYWLSLRSWRWKDRRASESARSLDDAVISSAMDRASQSEEQAMMLREHLWMNFDKEGISRWEASADAEAIRNLEAWWEGLSSNLGSDAFVAIWARKLASPGGAWARGAFAAAGFDAPESEDAAWRCWDAEALRAGGLAALRGAYASLQAEWMAPQTRSASPSRERGSRRGL